jgi:hypothetical protein
MKPSWILKIFIIIMSTGISPEDALAQGQKGKMYFSTQPFSNGNENSKNSFTSAEFIYGRIETGQLPLKEAFNMASIKTKPLYLLTTYRITRDDGREKYMQGSIYLRMDNGAENKTFFNFDITPRADQAKTTVSMVEEFNTGFKAGFFLPYADNSDYFWQNGKYKVELSIYLKSYDAWGRLDDTEKWPDITGIFTLQFDAQDVAAQMKNSEDGRLAMNENRMKIDGLPDFFSKPAKITDPNLTSAKIMAILKRDLPSVNIVKAVIPPFDGTLKDIAKNDLGLILFRYVRPYVRVIYKEDGKCYLGSVTLKEDYLGGGKYGPLKYHKFWGEEGLLDCALVK